METVRHAYASQARDPAFGDHWSGPPELVDAIAAILGTDAGHRVLDVGCGVGGPARRLAAAARCEVVGVDLVDAVLPGARASLPGRGVVRFVAEDAQALPISDRSVDQVWSLGTVAHLWSVDELAREAARVLRPKGRIAVTEGLATEPARPRFRSTAPRPWTPLTAETLTAALARAGLVEARRHAWPASVADVPSRDPALAADLAAGRLVPALVTARRP